LVLIVIVPESFVLFIDLCVFLFFSVSIRTIWIWKTSTAQWKCINT